MVQKPVEVVVVVQTVVAVKRQCEVVEAAVVVEVDQEVVVADVVEVDQEDNHIKNFYQASDILISGFDRIVSRWGRHLLSTATWNLFNANIINFSFCL
jgi:short subunit fatty acids transporter